MPARMRLRSPCAVALIWAAAAFLAPRPVRADLPILTLTVTTSNGNILLGNYDALSVDVDFYEIVGSNGYFVPADWDSLQDQDLELLGFPAGDGSGNGWEEFVPLESRRLAEGFLFGASTFSPGTVINMGPAFNTAIVNPQIELHFAVVDGSPFGIPDGTILDGVVQIVSGLPPMPDVNMDGLVDIFDINLISDNWGSAGLPGTVVGDATKDGVVNIFDINLVSENWNDGTTSIPVPEPGSIVLLVSALVGVVACRSIFARRK